MERILILAVVLTLLTPGPDAFGAETATLLAGFEAPYQPNKYPGEAKGEVALSSEWKSEGRTSLRIDPGLMSTVEDMPLHDWSGYDALRLQVHNPSGQAATIGFELADTIGHGYLDRHQDAFGAPSGDTTITLDIAGGLWRGEDNHPYRGDTKTPIDLRRIARFALTNNGAGAVWVDQVELVKVEKLATPGGSAFDFAQKGAQIMAQFIAVTQTDAYNAAKGYRLIGGAQGGSTPMAYPTPMLGSGLHWEQGFRVDLPEAGRYVGLIAFERGGFWEGEGSGYRHATLKADGRTVHEHDFTPDGLFFCFQDTEVTDLAQVADRIIWPAHAISRFAFTAAKGGTTFTLETTEARGAPLRVAGLIVAPDTAAGRAFIDEHVKRQRQAIATSFTPQDRGRRGDGRAKPAKDLVCEVLDVGEPVYPRDWPHAAARNAAEILAVPGQTVTVHLGVYANAEATAQIAASAPASSVTKAATLATGIVSHGRYLPQRPFGVGAIWLEINHYRPAPSCTVGPDLCRSVIVEYAIPADSVAGDYRGVVAVATGHAKVEVPVVIHVVAAKLAAVPIPLGLLCNALPFDQSAVGEATWWTLQESLLREQGAAGLTAITGGPGLELSFSDDGGAIAGAAALRYIKLAQACGLDRAVVAYGGFLSAPARPEAYAKAGATVTAFEAANRLPPLYLNCYDEPATPAERAKAIARLEPATAAGLRTLGFTSAAWDDADWRQMIGLTTAPAFNLHDQAMFTKVKELGRHPWIYNNLNGRYGYGIDLWRQIAFGCEGRLDWIGNIVQGFAFSNLDGREPSVAYFAVHRELGVLKTPGWLALKEGLTDLRLRLALERAAPAGDPALAPWTLDGYRRDADAWTIPALEQARAAMLKRLAELAKP